LLENAFPINAVVRKTIPVVIGSGTGSIVKVVKPAAGPSAFVLV